MKIILGTALIVLVLAGCTVTPEPAETAPASVRSFQMEPVAPEPSETPIAPVEVAPVAPVATETEIIPPNSLPAGSPVPFQNGKFDTGACASGTAYVEADGSGTCVD